MKIEKILGYEIHRKKVKNINLRINENLEVYISAPLNLHSDYIERFILSKENWINETKKRIENYKKNMYEPKYITGEKHMLLGREYTLVVKETNNNKVLLRSKEGEIHLYTKENEVQNRKKIMDKWYYNMAKEIFNISMAEWLKRLNEHIEHLSIKPMKSRWGSCNYNKKYINLNVNLIKRTPFEIEYVILHELAHLKYPNHGRGFYNYIENYMPNYKEAEKMLGAKHHYK